MQDYQQERALAKNRIRRRGIFLLPNLFTTAALFAGFYAIVQAMNVNFDYAAIAIFVAMVLDGLDGRVARMTHTQSAFGAEYDSLSDMVCFGAAPNDTMSARLSYSAPKALWVLVSRATRPSNPSSTMATKMAIAAWSKRPFIACTIA